MARIVMADDGIVFDGLSLERGPLGGVETAFVSLAEALARRGHEVLVRNRCAAPVRHNGVDWARLDDGLPDRADLYIANRGDRLIPLMPQARRTLFWIHNPAGYFMKPRYLLKLWRVRPTIVFLGPYHRATYPWWAPRIPWVIIPYGVAEIFHRTTKQTDVPPPRAIFTSNPMRSLDWLLDLWVRDIRPAVPVAELHVFSGAATYGGRKAAEMAPILDRARATPGVFVHEPVAKEQLVRELAASRVMLYRGDEGEVFCLALAESQTVGIPCVVGTLGNVAERIIEGETGFVGRDEASFVRHAVALLRDDALWRRQNESAWAKQRGLSWDVSAAQFEKLIP